jgi:hypothetical protein
MHATVDARVGCRWRDGQATPQLPAPVFGNVPEAGLFDGNSVSRLDEWVDSTREIVGPPNHDPDETQSPGETDS